MCELEDAGVESICIMMPREYSAHPLCKQMRLLIDEESLQDTEVLIGEGRTSKRMSGFLLSLVSPVLNRMVCGAFKDSLSKRLEFGEIKETEFMRVVGLSCGEAMVEVPNIWEVLELAKLADRLQMSEVLEALLAAACNALSPDTCADILGSCTEPSFANLAVQCRCLALERFDEVARTPGFIELDEVTVGALVEDDMLASANEEGIFEAVVKWMKGGADGLRGEELLRKVRFPLMDAEYLRGVAAAGNGKLLCDLVSEAKRIKLAALEKPGYVDVGQLGLRALLGRRGKGVAWGRYENGGERRLKGSEQDVLCVVECMGRVCSSSEDKGISIWNKSTLAVERELPKPEWGMTTALASWERYLIGGELGGKLRVWNVFSGRCKLKLEAHKRTIISLAVCGKRLVSSSDDQTVKVWKLGEDMQLTHELSLVGPEECVDCLTVWEGKVMGVSDKAIYVWDVDSESGSHEAKLEGHTDTVHALVLAGVKLISGASDETMRIWAVGTWSLLQIVGTAGAWVRGMTVSGSKLVTGSFGAEHNNVQVWDLKTLECEHILPQPAGKFVVSLLGMSGEVWGAVGEELVVWGRE